MAEPAAPPTIDVALTVDEWESIVNLLWGIEHPETLGLDRELTFDLWHRLFEEWLEGQYPVH